MPKRTRVTAAFIALLAASPLIGQEAPPNAPKFVKSVKASGVDVRYLDFRWDEAAFASLQKGDRAHPAAQRSWVLARLLLQDDPRKWNGKTIPVGPSLLVLNPARGGAPATLELRAVDMREIFVEMNVIAEPPEGETYQKAPAAFQKADKTAPLLDVALQERGRSLDVSVHYGDRKATITLER
jgi:hypothetical protein